MILTNDKNQILKITNIIAINNWTDDCDSIYERFLSKCFNKPRPFNDSFNILNQHQLINYKDLSSTLPPSIFKLDSCLSSFEELMDDRINQIFNTYNNVTLLWTGGCDSTAILAGIIKAGIPKSRYKILCTSSSIEESPKFFNYLIKNNLPLNYIGDASLYNFLNQDKSEIYINGCPEQIFRFPVTATGFHDYYFNHYKIGIPNIVKLKNIDLNSKETTKLIEIFENFIFTLDLPIAYTIDLMWLIVFSGMWNYAGTMFPATLDINARYNRSFKEFYKTFNFAHWAITNSLFHYKELDWYNNPINYRSEEKKYILKVFDDDEIRLKTKKYSQSVEDHKKLNRFITIFYDDFNMIKINKKYYNFLKHIVSK